MGDTMGVKMSAYDIDNLKGEILLRINSGESVGNIITELTNFIGGQGVIVVGLEDYIREVIYEHNTNQ